MIQVAPANPAAAWVESPAGTAVQAAQGRILPLPNPSVRPTPEDPLTVYLVTAEPGDAVWERFGHNGIWIANGLTGENIFWEWGIFSFEQEGFIPRLARGTMLYSMGARYLEDMLAAYARQDRRVWAQELRLTPAQERELQERIRINALPENREYIYDYYTDNCSTRARDALDGVLGGSIQAQFQEEDAGVSWRWHTRRLLRDMPLAEAGVQIVLGNPGDAPISSWDEMFLPVRLKDHLARASVETGSGPAPLVVSQVRLVESDRPGPVESPANRVPWALLLGSVLAGLVLLAAGRTESDGGGPTRRRLLGGILLVWTGLAGLLGSVLVVAWMFTDHDFWRWNENILLLNPALLLAAAGSLPLLAGRAPPRLLITVVRWCAGVAVMAAVLKFLPGLDQGNLDVMSLVLPVHLAAAFVLRPGRGGSGRVQDDAA